MHLHLQTDLKSHGVSAMGKQFAHRCVLKSKAGVICLIVPSESAVCNVLHSVQTKLWEAELWG